MKKTMFAAAIACLALSSSAFATGAGNVKPIRPPLGKNVNIRGATYTSLASKGAVELPGGKQLAITFQAAAPLEEGNIKSIALASGQASVETAQIKPAPVGDIGVGATMKTIVKDVGLDGAVLRVTNGIGKTADLKVQSTLMTTAK